MDHQCRLRGLIKKPPRRTYSSKKIMEFRRVIDVGRLYRRLSTEMGHMSLTCGADGPTYRPVDLWAPMSASHCYVGSPPP